jgi:hypothetical protein
LIITVLRDCFAIKREINAIVSEKHFSLRPLKAYKNVLKTSKKGRLATSNPFEGTYIYQFK